MSESFVAGARKLLAGTDDDDAGPARVATRAVQVLEQLTKHLRQLVGETGIRALLARSVALSSATFPWLAGTIPIIQPADSAWVPLRAAMETQDVHAIREGFALLLSTFFGLLGRLIGEPLMAHLLHDVWPEVFPYSAKEPT
jgi:hypothetical protein